MIFQKITNAFTPFWLFNLCCPKYYHSFSTNNIVVYIEGGVGHIYPSNDPFHFPSFSQVWKSANWNLSTYIGASNMGMPLGNEASFFLSFLCFSEFLLTWVKTSDAEVFS
jgi:hypothetical protein